MPNRIKYTKTPTANTIKAGNFVLGVVTGVTYGPTSTTSFYNGYDVPSGGYVVYQNKKFALAKRSGFFIQFTDI